MNRTDRRTALVTCCIVLLAVASNCWGGADYATSVYEWIPGEGPTGVASSALGAPDCYYDNGTWYGQAVGIGRGGSLTLRIPMPFFDRLGDDIAVCEVGSSVGGADDSFDVYVSQDGIDSFFVGSSSGDHTTFEISGTPHTGPFNYIKIVDTDTSGMYDGANIDAVAAIHSAPEPATVGLLLVGVAAGAVLRRRRSS